jgi:hypothetical protein
MDEKQIRTSEGPHSDPLRGLRAVQNKIYTIFVGTCRCLPTWMRFYCVGSNLSNFITSSMAPGHRYFPFNLNVSSCFTKHDSRPVFSFLINPPKMILDALRLSNTGSAPEPAPLPCSQKKNSPTNIITARRNWRVPDGNPISILLAGTRRTRPDSISTSPTR